MWHDGKLLAARGYLGAATSTGDKQQALGATSAVSLRHQGHQTYMQVFVAQLGLSKSEDGSDSMQAVDKAVAASAELSRAAHDGAAPLYLPDLAAMQRAGAHGWEFTPASAQSVLAVSLAADQPKSGVCWSLYITSLMTSWLTHAPGHEPGIAVAAAGGGRRSMLLLYTDQPRGLSQRQRSWAAAIASKLGMICTVGSREPMLSK